MDNISNLSLGYVGYNNPAYNTSLNPAYNMTLRNEILSAYTHQYIILYQLAAYILFAYVLYNNFFKKATIIKLKIPKIEKQIGIDIDELTILPAVIIFMISISF